MNNKKYFVLFIILSMLLFGCSKNNMVSIYNDNERISSSTNSFNLDIEKQSIHGQEFTGVINKIEGMDTIWTYECDEDMELDMTYILNVTRGKLKLVLISPDNSVTDLIETTNKSDLDDYATNKLQIKKGLNRIKIVAGSNTSVEFSITIPSGEFEELGISKGILKTNENMFVEIKKAQVSEGQSYGADMISLDYASDEVIIFHGYFGLFVYNLNESKIINSIDLESIGCNETQGDNYCQVTVSNSGEMVQLHNVSDKDMYVYNVKENILIKKKYEPLNDQFKITLTPELIKRPYYLSSDEYVEFQNGDIGYLILNDNTINSLEYIRGDNRIKIFNLA